MCILYITASPVAIHSQAYHCLQGYFSLGHFAILAFFLISCMKSVCLEQKVKSCLSLKRFGAADDYGGPNLPLGKLLWLRKALQNEESITE